MEYEGIIFGNIVIGAFASNVGSYLAKNPPRKMKVANYEWMNPPLGMKTYIQEYPNLNYLTWDEIGDVIGKKFRDKLRDVDVKHLEEVITPWEKKIISEHNAKFSIELYAIPTRRLSVHRQVDITCHVNRFNKKGAELLRKYKENIVYAKKEWDKSLSDTITGFRVYGDQRRCFYHQIVIDLWNDVTAPDDVHAITDVSDFIARLSNFLVDNYSRMWKRYK